jgi:solute carrier family 25 (mitochondrial iron transporter), member 28/37
MPRPAHALYFAAYEEVKIALSAQLGAPNHPAAVAIAGSAATLVNDAVATPLDVVKQRLQVRPTRSPPKP